MSWPITYEDVLDARERIAPHLRPTPLSHYPRLDAEMGGVGSVPICWKRSCAGRPGGTYDRRPRSR